MFRECLLGDVLTLKRGYDLPSQDRIAGSVPIVSSSGISGAHSEAKVKGPGVVTGRYGTIGEIHYVERDFWPLNTTLYVKDFKGNDPRFVAYFLKTLDFASRNAAAAVPGVNRNDLHRLPVKCPPLAEQRRIASILSAYDDLIENNTRRIAILEDMARRIYEEWFIHFRFPGHANVRMVESERGPIPEGWQVRKFEDCLESWRGGDWGSDEPNGEDTEPVFVIRGTDFDDLALGMGNRTPGRYIARKSLEKRKLRPFDIIVENSINAKSRSAGKTLLVTPGVLKRLGGDAIAASFCKVFRFHEPRLAPLAHKKMRYLFESGDMAFFQNVAANGIANFQAQRFVNSEVLLLPGDSIQRDQLFDMFRALTQSTLADSITNLRVTRDLLLPKLISGELDVSKMPEPEPV